jgi:hypothetical protein
MRQFKRSLYEKNVPGNIKNELQPKFRTVFSFREVMDFE